jgi:hypothetical protein
MMGDNRDNSRDSRTTSVGVVPAENMVGRADRLFFSHNGNEKYQGYEQRVGVGMQGPYVGHRDNGEYGKP